MSRERRFRPNVLLSALLLGTWLGTGCREAQRGHEEAPASVKVERVRNGHTVKIDSDEKLVYAGIRAPYEREPLFAESKNRNAYLVEGKDVRLRFDAEQRDSDDRLCAYVFAGEEFINEILVRDGLAWVRLTPQTRRFAKELLAAQSDARRARRGLWKLPPLTVCERYPADSKYGNFHQPTCGEVAKIKPDRRVDLKSRQEAFDQGFAPCAICLP